MRIARIVLVPVILSVPAGVQAETPDKVLEVEEITEQVLVEALTPRKKTRMRSFTVVSVKPPQASLLITFETNSVELTRRAKQALDEVGRALKSDKLAEFSFSIEGHADPRGGEDFNRHLSKGRADSVVDYLARNSNIGRERLRPIGKGDTELLNTSRPDAPENRRVTIRTLEN